MNTFRPVRKVARDARTGWFVTLAEARRRPAFTVVETIKYPPRPAARKRAARKKTSRKR